MVRIRHYTRYYFHVIQIGADDIFAERRYSIILLSQKKKKKRKRKEKLLIIIITTHDVFQYNTTIIAHPVRTEPNTTV